LNRKLLRRWLRNIKRKRKRRKERSSNCHRPKEEKEVRKEEATRPIEELRLTVELHQIEERCYRLMWVIEELGPIEELLLLAVEK